MSQNFQRKHYDRYLMVMSFLVLIMSFEFPRGILYRLTMFDEDKNQTYLATITINHNTSVPSIMINTGTEVSLFFNNWNLFSHNSDH